MTKKDLVTLAEVAQLEIHPHSSYLWVRRYTSNGEDYNLEIWQPHKDIKQAMEVLRSTKYMECSLKTKWSTKDPLDSNVCEFCTSVYGPRYRGSGKSEEEAICLAVLKAVEK